MNETQSNSDPPQRRDAMAQRAGRGGVAVLGAKVFFLVAGLAQQMLLPRVIGLAGYGAFSRVMAVANVVNNVMVQSSIQGVSRTVASAPGAEGQGLRRVLRVHVPLALVLGLAFAACAPLVARFEHAPHILVPLAVMGGVVLLYGLYAPLVGALNGRGLFGKQATLDVTTATLRTVALLGLGALFVHRGASGALGATVGAVAAAAMILPWAVRFNGPLLLPGGAEPSPSSAVPSERAYLLFLGPLAAAQLFTNLLMQVDITLLGRFLSQAALAMGMSRDEAATRADEWVGIYRMCQTFAFLPYQLLMSITQILFPMLARARADRDETAVRAYVVRGTRIAVLASGLMVGVVAAIPGSLLGLAFGRAVASRGAETLRTLALAQGAFALFSIAMTVLTSLGRERVAALLSVAGLALVTVGCALLVPQASFGEAQLTATALAVACGLAAALVVAALVVRAHAGAFVSGLTLLRAGGAFAAVVVLGRYLPNFGRLTAPAAAVGLGVLYVALLVLSRELSTADLAELRSLAKRRAATRS